MRSSNLRIRTVPHLAARLGIADKRLIQLAEQMSSHVRDVAIPKDDGGFRKAFAATGDLATVHTRIRIRLLEPLPLPAGFHGSVSGRSPVTNAAAHVQKPIVANADIKDYFPSIHHSRIYRLFVSLECSPDVARILTRITTYNSSLAQGFSTSPKLANLVLAQMWPRIRGLEESMDVDATAYVDDLTLSGASRAEKALQILETIVLESGFDLNPRKRKVMARNSQQLVNNLVVNAKVNVPKAERRRLRSEIYRAKARGLRAAGGESSVRYFRHLRGRLGWARYVNPQWGRRLASILDQLRPPHGS